MAFPAWQIKQTFDTRAAARKSVASLQAPKIVIDYILSIINSMADEDQTKPRKVLALTSQGFGGEAQNQEFMSSTSVEWLLVDN